MCSQGFRATPYLVAAVTETAPDLARFPETARTFLPGGVPIKAGDLITMPEYAATLRLIAAAQAMLVPSRKRTLGRHVRSTDMCHQRACAGQRAVQQLDPQHRKDIPAIRTAAWCQ